MSDIPAEIPNVTILTKANVYFDGGVISHTVLLSNGSKKTIGLIHRGRYHFETGKAERMEIVAGTCRSRLDGSHEFRQYDAGGTFEVPAKSGFDIEVPDGHCEYICSFLD